MGYYLTSNKVMQFTYQLQNTAPQMVQKQTVVKQIISWFVICIYMHVLFPSVPMN